MLIKLMEFALDVFAFFVVAGIVPKASHTFVNFSFTFSSPVVLSIVVDGINEVITKNSMGIIKQIAVIIYTKGERVKRLKSALSMLFVLLKKVCFSVTIFFYPLSLNARSILLGLFSTFLMQKRR